jgi:glycosyltransferase involved in cell wall biosynthesis
MKLKKANQLIKDGFYTEALPIYERLFESTGLLVYKRTIDYIKYKIEKGDASTAYVENSAKSILFVTAGLKGPTAGGGIATCFHSMIRTLSEYSDALITILYVAHPYYAKDNYTKWKSYYEENYGANLVFMEINKKNYGSQEMQRSFAILNYLVENESSFENVVFHDFMGLSYYSMLYKKYGLGLLDMNFILSAHGNHELSFHFGMKKYSTWNEKIASLMEREVFKNSKYITSPSKYYADWIEERYSSKPVVIPNIIYKSNQIFDRLNVPPFATNRKILIFYGRFERLKGLDLFIDSVNEMAEKGHYFNLLFAGNSTKIDNVDSVDYIKKKISGYLECHFALNCDSSALFDYAKENDALCVFPTLGETSSCVVVECILNGVKFIASDIPGIRELIAKEKLDNLTFKTGSMSSLCDKVINFSEVISENCLAFDMVKNQMEWTKYLSKRHEPTVIRNEVANPLISVVVPTSDRPYLLKESLISLLNQSYKNIEIIVVDDSSVESVKNKEICDQLNVKYILVENKSYKGHCCNVGVLAARGSYICFFDDDDIAKPSMLYNYIKVFNADPEADIVSGFADCFEHDDYTSSGEINVEYTSLAVGGGLHENLHINFFGKGTFIVKKSFFDAVGGYEVDEDPVPMVDYRFYIKSEINGAKIVSMPIAQYFYRKNSPNSLFYINKDKKTMQFKAKKSIEKILIDSLGANVGKSLASFVWTTSLPLYD